MLGTFKSLVFVVNADTPTRESLENLIRNAGWQAEAFASAHEFLARPRTVVPSCLLLDVSRPDFDGLEFQRQIASDRKDLPIIFLSGQCDIETAVRAMKAGALDFLTKPINEDSLLNAIRGAIKRSDALLEREGELHQLRTHYGSLTPREREVMTLVVCGLPNKQIGGELGISEITVKAHRGNVMRKMKADSLAHLVNMASRLRVPRSLTTQNVSAMREVKLASARQLRGLDEWARDFIHTKVSIHAFAQ